MEFELLLLAILHGFSLLERKTREGILVLKNRDVK